MEQPPLPTEQRKFRPLVERTWAGTELSLPRGATSMLGAAQCHGFGGGYRQSVPPSAMPMLGACKSLLPEQSKQRHAKNARLSNLKHHKAKRSAPDPATAAAHSSIPDGSPGPATSGWGRRNGRQNLSLAPSQRSRGGYRRRSVRRSRTKKVFANTPALRRKPERGQRGRGRAAEAGARWGAAPARTT